MFGSNTVKRVISSYQKMKPKLLLSIAALLSTLYLIIFVPTAIGQKKHVRDRDDRSEKRAERDEPSDAAPKRRVDDPAEEESLNRELWEFARRTPYNQILSYVAAEQRKSQAAQNAQVELPNGWRIAPAGQQVDVGRLPYEAVSFAGKLVV